jgi:hypothetical protein
MPFKNIQFNEAQKIYDLETESFIIPEHFTKEIFVQNIFSFKNIVDVKEIPEKQLKIIENLSENQIKEKINYILKEDNITSHGPTEILDIWTQKLRILDENDYRLAGFIIKGKSYKKIKIDDIAVNLIKATTQPNIELLILLYTGILDDLARKLFIDDTKMSKKMFCFIGKEDLARLYLAYT